MKRILLVGSGWRAETWARLIQKLPDYTLAAVVCRNEEKARLFSGFGANIVSSCEEGLQKGADFALVCVSKTDGAKTALRLSERLPVLSETPAGCCEADYCKLEQSNVYFAEQYPLRPRLVALKRIIDGGFLGRVHTLILSYCHGYHAVAAMRRLLGTGEKMPRVSSISFPDEYSVNRGRRGRIAEETTPNKRTLAFLDFGDARAVYDFSEEQYFSAIRRARIVVQGTRGELVNGSGMIRRGGEDVPCSLFSVYDGQDASLYPPDVSEIYFLGERVYENAQRGLRLSEEEIAMAECLCDFSNGRGYSAKECVLDMRISDQFRSFSF